MPHQKKYTPRKGKKKVDSPTAAGKSPDASGGMPPTLVYDQSFPGSTAVATTDAAAAAGTGSESAPADASDEIVGGGSDQEDAQSSPVGCAAGSDRSEIEGGQRGDANDDDDGDAAGVDRFNWSIEGVDCTKVDPGNLIGVVVSTDKRHSTCRIAVKHGLLHRAYIYHAVKTVDPASNNMDLHDLRDAFDNWRSLPKLTERAAARFISSVGGQGMIHCMCRGECNTNSCSCKKAGRQCSSRCHRNNSRCKNKHAPEIEDDGK